MRKQPTVIVRTVIGLWRNQRKRGVDSRNYFGIMWQVGETLEFPTSKGLDRTWADRELTLMPLIQAARSSELMLLHSFLTLGLVQAVPAGAPLTEMNNRAETTAMRRMLRKAMSRRS